MNAFSRDFRRKCAAINLAPAFRSWVIVAYALPEDREWSELAPMERELWSRRSEAALELFKHLASDGQPKDTALFDSFVAFTRKTAARRGEHD